MGYVVSPPPPMPRDLRKEDEEYWRARGFAGLASPNPARYPVDVFDTEARFRYFSDMIAWGVTSPEDLREAETYLLDLERREAVQRLVKSIGGSDGDRPPAPPEDRD